MKKLILLLSLLFSISTSFSAKNDTIPSTSNINVHGGYGIGSIYVFTKKIGHSYDLPYNVGEFSPISSIGIFVVGFDGNVSKSVSIGFDFSYIPLSYTGKKDNTILYYKDNILSGVIKLQLNYINTPMVRAYSGISLGVSYIFSNVTDDKDISISDKTIRPAGQLTLMGIRVGKKICGFGEFGFGTNGIIVIGVNYRF